MISNDYKPKIGIMLENLKHNGFNGELISSLFLNKSVKIDCLIINKKNQTSIFKRYSIVKIIEKILFKILTVIENILFNLFFKSFSFKKIDLSQKNIEKIYLEPIFKNKNNFCTYNEKDISKIADRELDAIIRIESGIIQGEILKITKKGIISFHHGDNEIYRGLPPGFWEVYNKNPSTGFIIQKLNEELDEGDVLFKGSVITKLFYLYNQLFVYKQSVKHFNKTVNNYLTNNNFAFIKKDNHDTKIYKEPNFFELLRYIFFTYLFLIKKIFLKIFKFKEIWSIAFIRDRFDKKNLEKFTKIENPKGRFIADPFLVKHDEKNYVFVEDFNLKKKQGSISCFKLENNKSRFLGKILEEDFHLSFPFIFKFNDTFYMCPETREKKDIRLYKCVDFPLKWVFHKTLIKNIFAVDTLIFNRDNIWWLLTNTDKNNLDASSELSIYFSRNGPLTEHWTPHQNNPIISLTDKARNAGLVMDNEKIFRISQRAGFNNYGMEFDINEIQTINEKNYDEKKLDNIKPIFFDDIVGTHHLSFNDEYSVIDIKKNMIKF